MEIQTYQIPESRALGDFVDNLLVFGKKLFVLSGREEFVDEKGSGAFIGMVPLKESLFDELNDYVIRQQIQYDDCDIYVESKIANGDIAVPRVVNKLLKYIDCKLTFAFAK